MNKPYIIIHTHTAIDGNIDIMDLTEFEEASRQYQELSSDPEKQQFNIKAIPCFVKKIGSDDSCTTHEISEKLFRKSDTGLIYSIRSPRHYFSIIMLNQ